MTKSSDPRPEWWVCADMVKDTGSSSEGGPVIAPGGSQAGVLGWILWAPTVLCDLAAVPQIWWPLVSPTFH